MLEAAELAVFVSGRNDRGAMRGAGGPEIPVLAWRCRRGERVPIGFGPSRQMSGRRKIFASAFSGREDVVTAPPGRKAHPEYYQPRENLATEIPRRFRESFRNPAIRWRTKSTGPESWEQMPHDVERGGCRVGSSGT